MNQTLRHRSLASLIDVERHLVRIERSVGFAPGVSINCSANTPGVKKAAAPAAPAATLERNLRRDNSLVTFLVFSLSSKSAQRPVDVRRSVEREESQLAVSRSHHRNAGVVNHTKNA